MKKRLLFLIALTGLMYISCECPSRTSDPISPSQVTGMYIATFLDSGETAYIDLKPDSTYHHWYRSADGQVYVDTGLWEYWTYEHRRYSIIIRAFTMRFPTLGECYCPPPNGTRDSTPVMVKLFLHRFDDVMQLRYCYRPLQLYIKRDSVEALP